MSGLDSGTRDRELSELRLGIKSALIDIRPDSVRELIGHGIACGIPATDLLDGCIVPVLESVGNDWDRGRLALSQVYMAARILEDAMTDVFKDQTTRRSQSVVVGVGLMEDYHVLGKRMVRSCLTAAGFPVVDLGRVTVDDIVEKVRDRGVDVLMLSALMLRSALKVKDAITALRAAGLTMPVYVGGGPFRFDPRLCTDVGADGMGKTASDAIGLMQTHLQGRDGS